MATRVDGQQKMFPKGLQMGQAWHCRFGASTQIRDDTSYRIIDHNLEFHQTYATTFPNPCQKLLSALLLPAANNAFCRYLPEGNRLVVNAAKKQFYFRAEDPERKTNYGQHGQGNHHGPADQTGRQKNPLYEFKIARSARAQTKRGHKT